MIGKVLASAVANARNNDQLDPDELYVSACFADEGTTLKRWRPRARGRATRIRKRTCHITVIVSRLPEDRLARRRARQATETSGLRSRRVAASRRGESGAAEAEVPTAEAEVSEADADTFDETSTDVTDDHDELLDEDGSEVDALEVTDDETTGDDEADVEEPESDEAELDVATRRPRRRTTAEEETPAAPSLVALASARPRPPPTQTTATPVDPAKRRRAEPWARRSIPTGSASA